MTKFEEVLNKVIFNGVAPRTNEKFYLKSTLLRVFSNYHSDEEFHELSEELDDTNDAYALAVSYVTGKALGVDLVKVVEG